MPGPFDGSVLIMRTTLIGVMRSSKIDELFALVGTLARIGPLNVCHRTDVDGKLALKPPPVRAHVR
jgi:hypothetical protein